MNMLESYNNCTFSTWMDKYSFNLFFWIPNSFSTFHDYGRGGTPFLVSPDATSLIFYHSEFLNNLRLPWKTEFALNFFTVLNILLTFKILSNLRLPWKTEFALNCSLYWNILYLSGFLSNLRLPWKQSLPWTFSLCWNIYSRTRLICHRLIRQFA